MYFLDLNPWAVLVAALIPIILGAFWYSPLPFGNHWLRPLGVRVKPRAGRTRLVTAVLASLAASLLMSYVLALLIKNLIVIGAWDGIVAGFFSWLGFVLPTTAATSLFGSNPRPIVEFAIITGYQLLSLVLMGGFLALYL